MEHCLQISLINCKDSLHQKQNSDANQLESRIELPFNKETQTKQLLQKELVNAKIDASIWGGTSHIFWASPKVELSILSPIPAELLKMGKRAFNLSSTSSYSELIVPGLKFSTAFHNWSQVSPSFALITWAFELKPIIGLLQPNFLIKPANANRQGNRFSRDQFKEIRSPIIDSLHRCQIGALGSV